MRGCIRVADDLSRRGSCEWDWLVFPENTVDDYDKVVKALNS